ncbi:hypothetical protein ABI59_21155 [Acidobacteria bacterium Mor1]|nr:hypothetical protein ABI59_21155 [Acidobacteria bacterium Mor1]
MPRTTNKPKRLAASALLILLFGSIAGAATLTVDPTGHGDFTTIQDAIHAAAFGDEVLVGCGVYFENIVMQNGRHVRGEDRNCAIIDGGRSGSVVTFPELGVATGLSDLTIRNGFTQGNGGGIRIEGGSPTITRNLILDNRARDGGGIYLRSNGDPAISGNIIEGNHSTQSGGGIHASQVQNAVITTNLILSNSASFTGSSIHVSLADLEIVGNTFFGNTTEFYSAGIYAWNSTGLIGNNVFFRNTGLASYPSDLDAVDSSFTYASNISYANNPSGTGFPSGVTLIDPQFVDEESLKPRSDSPLIDAATLGTYPALDVAGFPRSLDGDLDGLPVRDIGAVENTGITRVTFDGDTLRWDEALGTGVLYNVYRGDLQTLRTSGVYTQDPASIPQALESCLIAEGLVDDDVPAAGSAFFYLVTAVGSVESSLGFDATPTERPRTRNCGE